MPGRCPPPPMAKPPARLSSSQDIDQFLQQSRNISEFVARQPRLLFAIDATASRQPTWDRATAVQQEMFLATGKVAALAVQLAYYRGFQEFFASPWLTDSEEFRLAQELNIEIAPPNKVRDFLKLSVTE